VNSCPLEAQRGKRISPVKGDRPMHILSHLLHRLQAWLTAIDTPLETNLTLPD